MSDKQMVSVPRELLERCKQFTFDILSPQAIRSDIDAVLTKPAEQHQGEQDSYPPCDYCGATPEHHPWHGSGLLNGAENRHIHACDGYRGKLPLHPDQSQVGPVAVVDEGDDGLFVELIYGDNGNPLRRGDKLYTRPAQGEVVGWQFYQQSKWWNGDDRIKDHRKNTEAAGIPTRDVYIHADPAEVEQLRDASRLAKHWCDAALNAIQMGSGNPDALNDVACLLRHMAKDLDSTAPASSDPSAPHEEARWHPLTAPGQIQEGDRLSFRVGSSFICARARQIIASGTDKEEVVYNRKKNHYFLTSMAVDGTSSHKNVMVARVTA